MDSIFFPIFDFILYIYNSIPVIEVDWVEILSFYKKCFIGIVFLLNKINFPVPKKDIEKTISNENFKIVK